MPSILRCLPAPLWVIGAMMSVQLGAALSVPLFSAIGPSGTTWLRLMWATAFLALVARPRLAGRPARSLAGVVLLGFATAGMTLSYFEAVARIPLGMATTIELLGPLGVAVLGARRLSHLLWAALAGLGVLLLAGNSLGEPADRAGVAFAAAAAACWAGYILLTKRVGAAFPRLEGLAASLLVAACVAAPAGLAQAAHAVAPAHIAAAAGLAVLAPLLPYALEMASLRRMTTRSFGVLMSAEPAVSALVGLLVLQQRLGPAQLAGIACVMAASIGATRGDRREAGPRQPQGPIGPETRVCQALQGDARRPEAPG